MGNERPAEPHEAVAAPSLPELALVFLKLGTIAFGGPAAHIALMEHEFVTRRRWLTREQFLDRIAASNLLPGPSSTEMAIFIGYEKGRLAGLLIAGACFIIPAALLVSVLAAGYLRYGALPQVSGIFYALKPVVIAIVLQAFWNLARGAVKSRWLAAAGVAATVLYAVGTHELLVLLIAALFAGGPLLYSRARGAVPALLLLAGGAPALAGAAPRFGLGRLFLVFAKTGAVLFGSGYVLLAFLRADLVDRLHWLTQKQLLDAVAVGQITPGPVFTTATFIGYLIGGPAGAVVATLGIFAPAFFFVGVSSRILPRIRRSPLAAAMLDGVVVGSLALMAVVAWQLGR
ncbi:MAG: Chromate transporter, partial [Acidobacteria bacterium]|nr:Chromate transporter [Acidobacteriota bacterium]